MKRPFIWAHRGASAWAPENTVAAFNAAVESRADGIELDIHLTADNVPVVLHDETLERTTDGSGAVSSASSLQIETLDAGSWFSTDFAEEPVPFLVDVLKVFSGQLCLNLEIKEYRAGLAVLELLTQFPDADIVVSSFDYDVLQQLRSTDHSLALAVLFDSGSWRRAVALAKDLSASSFHPAASLVSRPMIAECKKAGLPVHVWTVDSIPLARSLFRAGVCGLFANDPAALRQAFSG